MLIHRKGCPTDRAGENPAATEWLMAEVRDIDAQLDDAIGSFVSRTRPDDLVLFTADAGRHGAEILAALDAPATIEHTGRVLHEVVGSDAKVAQSEPSKPAVQIPGMPTAEESSAVSDTEADEMEEPSGASATSSSTARALIGSTHGALRLLAVGSATRARHRGGRTRLAALGTTARLRAGGDSLVPWSAGSPGNGSRTGHLGSTSVPSSRGTTG